MKDQSKLQGAGFWKGHFASWKASGLTQSAYCLREGISYQSFVYQQTRANSKLKKVPIKFIEATIKSSVHQPQNGSGLQVILPNGVRISIDGTMTEAFIQTVFTIAGNIQC